MPSLETAGNRFSLDFRVLSGGQVSGVIDTPPENQPPAYQFLHPRQILQLQAGRLTIGSLIQSPAGIIYACAYNGVDEQGPSGVLFESFRLIEMTQSVEHKIEEVIKDSMSGVDKTNDFTSQGNIWATFEPLREQFDREFGVRQDIQRMITTTPVALTDKVGRYEVVRVDELLGIYLAEVRG